MTTSSIGTPEQLRDPNYTPALHRAVPLGIQHVLAMFVSNVTPAIIIAGAAGFGFGSDAGAQGFPDMTYLIQMSMLFAGIATLFQTIGLGPMGARLPVVQGTSFAFIPIMIPLVAGKGVEALPALFGGVIIGGIFHAIIGTFIGKIRFALPPLVTGLVVMMIGLALVKVGIQYAAGGVPAIDKPEYGSLLNWSAALVVILVTLGLKFYARGMLSVSAVFLGIIAGYLYAMAMGMVSIEGITTSWDRAATVALPEPFKYGFEMSVAAIVGFCLMAFVSAVETVGDVSGIAGIFGGFPNTSFSQNVGLIAMTGVMSRHVVTIGAIFLIVCGLIPKVGAVIRTIPIEVLGGGVIVMFGMVVAAGVSMLSDVNWNRRNMVIFAIALSVGLGLQLDPKAVQYLPDTLRILMTSGLLPAAIIAIVLNLILPEDLTDEATGEVSGGMARSDDH
jgi:NCS2 family nucleobase:cation symporter-2